LLVVLLLALALPSHGALAEPDALAARVELLLGAGVESSGAHDAILALGEAGALALIAVFERAEAARFVRLRALSELQRFESETSARYFATLVQRASAPDTGLGDLHPARSALVLRRALEGLIPTARSLTPAPPLTLFSACLEHPDAHVRKAASAVLSTLDDRGVEPVMTKQLNQERSRMVRASLERGLTNRSALRRAPR
jgi:hypothetical protein